MARISKIVKALGGIIHRGISAHNGHPFTVVATVKSKNPKTGNMVQLYILPDSDFVKGADRAERSTVCFDCIMLKMFACYVNVAQAPSAILRKLRRNGYDVVTSFET